MMKPWKAALASLLFASPAVASGAGYTVNIHTTSNSFYSDRITEVVVTGVGTYNFPDDFTAPLLTETSVALETALDELGVPDGTVANVQGTQSIGTDEVTVEEITSNYNPIDNPDYVIGDPEDPWNYFAWIAIGKSNVDVYPVFDTTYYTFYRMTADIPAACAAGSYSATGQEPCTPCAAGYAQASTGATSCTPCTAGTFASGTGNTQCTNCGPGTFELDLASTGCDACPGGQATPCNNNGVCSDGPTGNGSCACNVGYTGFACENGPPPTTSTTLTTTTTTSTTTFTTTTTISTTTTSTTNTTTTTLPEPGPCPALPQSGCAAATTAVLSISTSSDPAKDKLKWKLSGGSLAVDQALLGNPASTTSWHLCLYDSTVGVSYLAGSISVSPSSAWTSADPKGWKYKDKAATQAGVTGMSLKTGVAGKAKAQLKGAGTGLPLPPPFSAAKLFEQSSTVAVQLVKDGGPGAALCWTSDFDINDTKLNTAAKFKAAAK